SEPSAAPLPCRKALPKALWVGYPAPRPGWARSIWAMSDQALIGRLEPSGGRPSPTPCPADQDPEVRRRDEVVRCNGSDVVRVYTVVYGRDTETLPRSPLFSPAPSAPT